MSPVHLSSGTHIVCGHTINYGTRRSDSPHLITCPDCVSSDTYRKEVRFRRAELAMQIAEMREELYKLDCIQAGRWGSVR